MVNFQRALCATPFVALLLAGCSDDPGTTSPDVLAPPPASEGLQLTMQARIDPGMEVEYCQYVVLPAGVDVGRFQHEYSPGSHHLLLYMTTLEPADVVEDLERFDCASRDDLALAGIAYAAQMPKGATAFPEGVAMRFEKDQVVLMQTHYLNVGEAAIDADVRLNLWGSRVPVEQEAGTLFFYDYTIVVPAHGKATAEMRCEVGADFEMTFAMSHMHRRGTGYRSRLTGGGLDAPVPLYETDRWEGVEPLVFDPPLAVSKGQAIEFECDYQNDGAETIIEGPSASKNEMCMFVATYWPRLELEDEFCARPGSGPVHHGEKTCAETLECFQATKDVVEREQCQMSACQASSAALADFNHCLFFNCQDQCPDGEACTACITEHCAPAYLACQSADC